MLALLPLYVADRPIGSVWLFWVLPGAPKTFHDALDESSDAGSVRVKDPPRATWSQASSPPC